MLKRINRLARRAEIRRRRESEFQWPMGGLRFEEVETTEERMFWSERRASCVEAAQTTRGSGYCSLLDWSPRPWQSVPAARLPIQPGETRVVSVLV